MGQKSYEDSPYNSILDYYFRMTFYTPYHIYIVIIRDKYQLCAAKIGFTKKLLGFIFARFRPLRKIFRRPHLKVVYDVIERYVIHGSNRNDLRNALIPPIT